MNGRKVKIKKYASNINIKQSGIHPVRVTNF